MNNAYKCPICGYTPNRTSPIVGHPDLAVEQPGDLQTCEGCHAINVFQVDGTLRPATDDEAAALPAWMRARLNRS